MCQSKTTVVASTILRPSQQIKLTGSQSYTSCCCCYCLLSFSRRCLLLAVYVHFFSSFFLPPLLSIQNNSYHTFTHRHTHTQHTQSLGGTHNIIVHASSWMKKRFFRGRLLTISNVRDEDGQASHSIASNGSHDLMSCLWVSAFLWSLSCCCLACLLLCCCSQSWRPLEKKNLIEKFTD